MVAKKIWLARLAWLFACALSIGTDLCGIAVYFSPGDNIEAKIIKHIKREQRSIKAALYLCTSSAIADALVAAKRRGVSVEVILDRSSTDSEWGKAEDLAQGGVPILVYNGGNSSIMHHKFWLFGDGTTITGSYNATRKANKNNHENIIILNDVAVMRSYEQEFNRLKRLTAPYHASNASAKWPTLRIDKTIRQWLGF